MAYRGSIPGTDPRYRSRPAINRPKQAVGTSVLTWLGVIILLPIAAVVVIIGICCTRAALRQGHYIEPLRPASYRNISENP